MLAQAGRGLGLLEEGGYKGGIRGPQKIPIFWGADDHLLALSKGGPPLEKKPSRNYLVTDS